MWTNAQKRSRRKRIKPWTVVSSGGLGEVDKRKKVFFTFYLLGCVGGVLQREYTYFYKSGEQKRDNKICGCQGLVRAKTE